MSTLAPRGRTSSTLSGLFARRHWLCAPHWLLHALMDMVGALSLLANQQPTAEEAMYRCCVLS
jgi:hypothetical protein